MSKKKISVLLSVLLSISITSVYGQQLSSGLETSVVTSVDFNERSFYMLINRATGLAMDVEDRSIINNSNIMLAAQDIYAMHQVWRMDDIGDGVYNLVNAHSDKVVRDAGSNVQQERDGKSNTHRWKIEAVGDHYFKLTNVGRKTVLTADGTNVTGAADNGSESQQWRILEVKATPVVPDFSLQGFATVGQGTTGGAGGQVVVVKNESELKYYMQHNDPYIILIEGTIVLGPGDHHSPQHNMHSIAPNKTLFGLEGATIKGGGFNIRGTRNDGVGQVTRTNVIIRNLIFDGGAPDDYINIEHGASNVWIDHNTFNGPNADGMVDVKREASFVTISWNIIHTNHKTMLLGHDDKHHHDRGYLKVTYHHNYVYNSQSRHPRMRYGRAHLFNNYFENIGDYVMGPGIEAEIVSENNHVWVSGRFTDWYHTTGKVLERGQGSLINRINHDHDPRIKTSQIDWGPEDYYTYKLYPAIAVREMVLQHAGAGVVSWDDPMPEFYTLTTHITGNGEVSPSSGTFNTGSDVTVTATPAAGWVFDSWEGAVTGNQNPVTIIMNSNKALTAKFTPTQGGGDNGENNGKYEYQILFDWNFSSMSEYSSDFNVNGSQHIAGATLYNNIGIDGMVNRSQEIDGVTYTYNRRVKLGGAGTFDGNTPTARVYAFNIPGNSRITIVCQSSSSSENRTLNIATSPDNILSTATAPGSSLQMTVYEYSGPATDIYLYSPSSGVNLYHVRVEELKYTGSTTVHPISSSDKRIISEEYYNLSGIYQGNNFNTLNAGMYIKIIRYEDGTVKTQKFLRNK